MIDLLSRPTAGYRMAPDPATDPRDDDQQRAVEETVNEINGSTQVRDALMTLDEVKQLGEQIAQRRSELSSVVKRLDLHSPITPEEAQQARAFLEGSSQA